MNAIWRSITPSTTRDEQLQRRHSRVSREFQVQAAELVAARREIANLRRHNSNLREWRAKLKAERTQLRKEIRKTKLLPERLRNRIIVLKARNYQLTQQLAEANAFLEKT